MSDQRDELPPELMAAIAAHEQAHGSGEVADFDVAVAAWNKALSHPLIVGTPRLERMAFNQIGTALLERYDLSGSEDDLDRAIKFTGQAVRGEPKGSDMLSRFQAAFSSALRARYVLHRDDADLTAAAEAMALSVSELRLQEPGGELADRLTELSVLRRLRYEADGDLDALDEAAQLAGQALAFGGLGPAQRAKTLTVFGNALMIRSVHRPEDLEKALAAYQEALDLGTYSRAGRPILLINIGTLLLRRFNGAEDLADLERATACLREAESDPGLTEALRPALVMKLAEALQTMSELSGDRRELDEFVAGPFANTLERTVGGSPYRRDATSARSTLFSSPVVTALRKDACPFARASAAPVSWYSSRYPSARLFRNIASSGSSGFAAASEFSSVRIASRRVTGDPVASGCWSHREPSWFSRSARCGESCGVAVTA